jgi:uncharacterized membrane protein
MTRVSKHKHRHKQKQKKTGFFGQYFKAVRFYLATGLMVWIPLIVTVWLTWWLFKNVGLGIENLIQDAYIWLNGLGGRVDRLAFLSQFEYRKGFGFLLSVALFLATGILARNLVGQRIIRMFERQIGRVPVLNRVYKAVRQIRDVFVNRDGAVFQEVCMVEYPRKGVYAMAFITSHEQGLVQEALNKELVAVFVPTTPNPTSGFLLYLPKEEIESLDVSVEEAMKLIISAGAYIPGDHDDDEKSPIPLPPMDS